MKLLTLKFEKKIQFSTCIYEYSYEYSFAYKRSSEGTLTRSNNGWKVYHTWSGFPSKTLMMVGIIALA